LNGSISATFAAVFCALKHVFVEVPNNAGIFRPVTVIAPETTFLNAQFPRAVSGSSAEVSLRVMDAVFGALAQALPDRVPAACFGSVTNLTVSGQDPQKNKRYIMFRFSGGGYGGHPDSDGLTNGNAPISCARTSPIETCEHLYPLTFDYYRIRNGSGGAGLRRGGLGVEYQVQIRRGEALSSVLGDRGLFPPYGLQGGGDGKLAEVEFTLKGKSYVPHHITKDEGITLATGDLARVASPGGGGWGDPFERDAAKVLTDVIYEFVTPSQARDEYGVAVVASESGWSIDWTETDKVRRLKSVRLVPA
jgi:N-methylhydantoinase B